MSYGNEHEGYKIRVYKTYIGVRARFWKLSEVCPITAIPLTEYDTGIDREDLALAAQDARDQIDRMGKP